MCLHPFLSVFKSQQAHFLHGSVITKSSLNLGPPGDVLGPISLYRLPITTPGMPMSPSKAMWPLTAAPTPYYTPTHPQPPTAEVTPGCSVTGAALSPAAWECSADTIWVSAAFFIYSRDIVQLRSSHCCRRGGSERRMLSSTISPKWDVHKAAVTSLLLFPHVF